jgi:V/A-type H+-transporting ATPase subunit F
MKGKMAIIGDGDGVIAFTAGGIDAYPVTSPEKAGETLKKLAKEYSIIFITDVLAEKIDEIISRYVSVPYPIIIPVPSKSGSNGYGMQTLKTAMDKALGVDILFGNND